MNPKIQAIINQAPTHLVALLTEAEDEIEKALVAAADEAQANEATAKLAIGFKIALNLDKNAVEYSVSFGVRHTLTACTVLPDPNQPEFAMENN